MTETPLQAWAALVWPTMDDNEKAGVRFGLFPAGRMQEAEKAFGWTPRELAVALMDEAKKDGGMIA
jgi:hypothetical protein